MNRSPQLSLAPLTPMIKWIIITTTASWLLLQVTAENLLKIPITQYLAMTPSDVLFEFKIWQLFTYMGMHSNQVTHLLFNMLMLWFFGGELEAKWGGRRFLAYYLMTGVGAALVYCFGMSLYAVFSSDTRQLIIPVIGASGAMYGVLLAYGILFGERTVYFFMIFPMKAKIFVALMGLIEFANMVSSQNSGSEVAYLAHLGGLVSGIFVFWGQRKWNLIKDQRKNNQKGRHLHLVIDNDKKDENPKYWN
ncbi:MAG: rhomboid family intramembrane serine protease [Bdellovibrionales bacterium]